MVLDCMNQYYLEILEKKKLGKQVTFSIEKVHVIYLLHAGLVAQKARNQDALLLYSVI